MTRNEEYIISRIFEQPSYRHSFLEKIPWFIKSSYTNLDINLDDLYSIESLDPEEIKVNYIKFINGTITGLQWNDGLFKSGTFMFSEWYNGKFESGIFESSFWENGIFVDGEFLKSYWKDGIWRGGTWGKSNKIYNKFTKSFHKSNVPPNECEFSLSYRR